MPKKAKSLIEVVKADPFAKPPAYEPLVGNLSDYYSRRISIQHRFVYQVYPGAIETDSSAYEGDVKVVRMWSHYDNAR